MQAITTTPNDVKERLSLAYLAAVAARAGCEVLEPRVDRMSIDAIVQPIRGANVRIDVQLKATSGLALSGSHYPFSLPKNNYDALRNTMVESARLLVVLDLPSNDAEWMAVDENSLSMFRACYWLNLHGEPDTPNSAAVTVYLPQTQVLTPQALQALLDQRLQKLYAGQGGF